MSIEIIPAGASAVVTERDHAHKSYDDGEVQIMRDVKDARHDLIVDNEARFVKLNDTMTQAASAVSLASSHTVEILQNGFAQAAVASTAGFAGNALAISDAQRELEVALDRGFDAVNDSVQSASKEGLLAQYQLASAAVRTAVENQGNTMLAFKDVQLAQEKLSREGELQAATLASLQERLAAQASKESAMCCCETKATIVAEGTATRALINEIERDRLRDGKAKAEGALAAYFAAKVAPTVPVV